MSSDDAGNVSSISKGRYLYCVVATDTASFRTEGVADEPVYAVEVDGLAAIVHACDSLYDADDLDRVRGWLLDHQSVVDEAGESFGTPLPFRFDTVIEGEDHAVRDWLRDVREEATAHLADLAGYWEYRVEVVRTDDPEFDDRRLEQLRDEAAAADEGRTFLLEKQLDSRRAELRAAADEALTADLRDRLEPLTRRLDPSQSGDAAETFRSRNVVDASRSGDTVAAFTLLVDEDDEGAVGKQLDAVADQDGLEVRFTGPWPPYSFAPEL